jgi:signal transduction histidine kinase
MVDRSGGLGNENIPVNFDLALLSNFVHQVINPLNGVAGTLDNLIDGTISEDFRREQRLRATRAQVEQCITLMRNLAFLSRGFTPITPADRRYTVLPQAIIESAMFYQEDGRRKNIGINLVERQEQNRVLGHPELIRQVLMNIFDNWVKYGRRDSEVVIHQRIQANTDNAIITITGHVAVPIPGPDLPRIFELGFRGGNARQIVASGTGLGLYISKEIVEKVHGGSLRVQTAPDNGLEFTIKLPNGEAS